MNCERKRLKDEAAAVSKNFGERLSEAQEELEILREALLQSGAETRRCWLLAANNDFFS